MNHRQIQSLRPKGNLPVHPWRLLLPLLLFIICPLAAQAQSGQALLDSLRRQVEQVEGIDKLKAHHRLCYMLSNSEAKLEEQIEALESYQKEADRQQVVSHQASARTFILTVYKNAYAYDAFFARLPEVQGFLYAHGHGQDNFQMTSYYNTVRMANELYLEQGQSETAIRRAQELYLQASADNDRIGMSTLTFCLAQSYELSRQFEKAEEYFRQSLDLAQKVEKEERRIAQLQNIYVLYGRSMMDREKYTETLALCDEWLHAIAEQEDFERRVVGELKNTLYSRLDRSLLLIRAYAGLQQFAQADSCRLLVEEMQQQQDFGPWELYIDEALFELAYHRKDYAAAQPLLTTLLEAFRQYDSPANVAALLEKQAVIQEQTNQYALAAAGYREAIQLRDSIQNAQFTAQLNDLHTIYEVDKITAQKERNRIYFLMALLACTLLVIALAVWIVYSQRLRRKNRALYQQIEKQRRLEKETTTTTVEAAPEKLSKEMQLFVAFKNLLLTGDLYLSAELDRHRLIEQLGTNERYLIEAVHAGSGMTISGYIAQLRLRYALELLHDHPELTLEAVALDSGHASYSTFFRAFTKAYGMSPTEYRKINTHFAR
ncbi:helix-turn-helix domain-containing protein [Parabacteroides sp. PF5-6]|uniref:helix-turn-helix domain-containing protein n=1 Tax=Parabacteroides sp. PF5-6 TaxID=1742403 RepID=UPI002407576C|nr:helix-turn-helix domain-containing protein [Parabacteroides sp. PF5-6]MDF9830197.1 AraC-like DNA-binding protein [Parabacteroides sp. PF5-6]